MDHATSAVTPLDREVVQAGGAVGQRAAHAYPLSARK